MIAEKLKLAMDWFRREGPDQQLKAVEQLMEHALVSEWINVWPEEDREWMAEEDGAPLENYEAPYFTTCGENLGE